MIKMSIATNKNIRTVCKALVLPSVAINEVISANAVYKNHLPGFLRGGASSMRP